MNRITVGIVSNNRRLRVAYRLLLEQEGTSNIAILWDTLLGEDVKTCQTQYGQPDILLVDYEGAHNQSPFGLEDLNLIFPESSFLLICDDCEKSRERERGVTLRQFLVSKYCSVQTLLSAISKAVLTVMLSKKQLRTGIAYLLFLCFLLTSCVDLSESRDDGQEGATSTPTEQQGQAGNSAAQNDESTTDVSVNPSEFEGTYEATLPCKDCEGIHHTIVINNDQTFRMSSEYLGKDETLEDNGRYKLIENASIIHLRGTDTDLKLRIGEDKLFQLDKDDEIIEGKDAHRYVYTKKE